MQLTETTSPVIDTEQMRQHWQGHRGLTRKVIEAYPEEHFFTYSIGGMRPFSVLVLEMLDMAEGGMPGIATGQWKTMSELRHVSEAQPTTKEEILQLWDHATQLIDELWPTIPPERFQQVDKAFGLYEAPVYSTLLYFIDNEIHHRGQAYVYLRSLGITPPPFWEH